MIGRGGKEGGEIKEETKHRNINKMIKLHNYISIKFNINVYIPLIIL